MRVSPGKLAAVFLSCSTLWAVSDLVAANLQVQIGLRRQLSTNPALSISSIWSNPLNGRLYIRGVHTAFGRTRVDIGALNLSSPIELGLVTKARAQTKPTGSNSASSTLR